MNLQEKIQYVKENLQYLPVEEYENYRENFAIHQAKTSSSIEGEKVTLAQAIAVIKGHNVGGDSTLNRNVYNHYKAFLMVRDAAEKGEDLTEDFFKDVHERLVKGVMNGGLYRNVDIKIKGSAHTPCTFIKVYDRMAKFFYDINHFEGTDLELIAYTHLQIAKVHPFIDANGRIARLMMNYQLIKLGYLPVYIPAKMKEEYFNSLEEFKVNKTSAPFMAILETRLNREYDKLIEVINTYRK